MPYQETAINCIRLHLLLSLSSSSLFFFLYLSPLCPPHIYFQSKSIGTASCTTASLTLAWMRCSRSFSGRCVGNSYASHLSIHIWRCVVLTSPGTFNIYLIINDISVMSGFAMLRPRRGSWDARAAHARAKQYPRGLLASLTFLIFNCLVLKMMPPLLPFLIYILYI